MRFACRLGLALLVLGCAEEEPTEHVEASFVVAQLAVDPATELGDLFLPSDDADATAITEAFQDFFTATSCGAAQALAFHVRAERGRVRGAGDVSLLIVLPEGRDDLCAVGGRAIVQPPSYRPDGVDVPWATGPLYIEGLTLDSRLSIGDIGMAFGSLVEGGLRVFPRWWSLRARISPFVTGESADAGAGELLPFTMRDTELSAVWLAGERLQQPALGEAPTRVATVLDQLVTLDLQPDVDVDGDGLEAFRDEDGDGRVEVCVDGDGTRLEGTDCPRRAEIADGYLLQLRFRVYPVTLSNPPAN